MEWVLRHAYGIDRDTICTGFQKLMGLPNISVEDWQAVFQAILWYRSGLDFADALHLSSSGHADKFVTFDKSIAKKVRELNTINVTLA
jgi:predicted nucleic-acid-binding protein